MRISIKYVLFFAVVVMAQSSAAQFLDYGVDPHRYHWNYADISHYRLIYPRGLDSLAYRYALYLENAYPLLERTLGSVRTQKFPVVMHPGSMLANGIVAWAPRRMELLTTPSSRQHAEPWEQHLAVHESRHVLQMGKLSTGLFRPFYYLMGEQASGLSAAFVPRWFLEGDAVCSETGITLGGRGRLPEFQMIYRAQMLGGKFFSFDKWHLGSYRDAVGTFYTLGYDMTAFARYRFGADVWAKSLTSYVRRPISWRPMGDAFKRQTGIGFSELFRQTFEFLGSEWARADSNFVTPAYLSASHRHYTSLQYPQALNDSVIVALRTGLRDISAVVLIADGKERRLAYTASGVGKLQVDAARRRIYWTETVPHLRWTHQSAVVVRYMDLPDGKVRTFAPAYGRIIQFAAWADRVALSIVEENGDARIVVLDAENGQEVEAIAMPAGTFAKDVALGGDATVYAAVVGASGISLYGIESGGGRWRPMLEGLRVNVNGLAWAEGRLLFESGADGINNIYGIEIGGNEVRRLSRSRFGAFQPSAHKGRLLYADYQPEGYRIAAIGADSIRSEVIDLNNPQRFTLAEAIAGQESPPLSAENLQAVKDFHPRPYAKLSHLFNVHSWAPLYFNLNDLLSRNTDAFLTAAKPGLMVISQNSLNTAISQAAWYYSDGNHHGAFHFTYMGWLPVINLRADVGGKAYDMMWETKDDKETVLRAMRTSRPALNLEAQVYVPLTQQSGGYVRGLRPSVSWQFVNDRYQQYQSKRMPFIQQITSELHLYAYRRMALQEVLPRLGFQLRLQQLHIPFQPHNIGDLYAIRITGYLPGLMRSHSLMLRAGWQYQDAGDKVLYNFNHLLETPRGHAVEYRTERQAILQADYAFPIITPDLSIGSLAYIRRIRTNLFGDVGLNQVKASEPWDKARCSFGADLIFDWNALRLSYALQTGLRIVRPLKEEGVRLQLISSISF